MLQVFVVSYPKCGRTWLRLMLGRAVSKHVGRDLANPLELDDLASQYPGVPPIVFTHDGPANLKTAAELSADDKRKYAGHPVILLVRDPADVAVSYYFEYTRRRTVFNPARFETFDGQVSDFLRRDVGGVDSIIAFYDGWARHLHVPSSFLLVRYEDMHTAPARELRRVLDFVGLTAVSDEIIADAVAYGRFDNMRKLEQSNALDSERLQPADLSDPESFKTRRGVVGGHADYLSADDIRYVRERGQTLPALFNY